MGYKSTVDTMIYFAKERYESARKEELSSQERLRELERASELARCLDEISTGNPISIRIIGSVPIFLTCDSDCELDLVKKLLLNVISKVVPNINQ